MVRSVARAARPLAAGVGAGFDVVLDDLAQEVAGFDLICCWNGGFVVCRTHALDFRRRIQAELAGNRFFNRLFNRLFLNVL
jgi:hypothetical protein